MAINPIRVAPLELPPNPNVNVPINFGFLGDLGGAIGNYRERREMEDILAGAVDPSGNFDLNKAATAFALRGRPELARKFVESALDQQRLAQSQAYQQRALELREQEVAQGKTSRGVTTDIWGNPVGYELGPGGAKTIPLPGTGMPQLTPPTAPAPTTPGPQSALEPSSFNERFLGGGTQAPGQRVQVAAVGDAAFPSQTIRPEPTTQIAQAAPTAPVAGDRNQWVLDQLPQYSGQIKAWAEYDQPPPKALGLHEVIRQYRPDWKASQYEVEQKRREQEIKTPTVSGETAARLGIANLFQLNMKDRTDAEGNKVPGIASRIKAGELNRDWNTALQANYYKGGPGEIRRLIDDGAEALVRMLTGAGMSMQEASDYGNRFKFRVIDNPNESLAKAENLDNVLTAVSEAVRTGKVSPESLGKIIQAKQSRLREQPAPPSGRGPAVRAPPEAAVRALQVNPALRDQFDAKYGAGASNRVLGR